jgi:hypothetical protein
MLLRPAILVCCCALLGGCFTPSWKKKAVRPLVVSFPKENVSDGTKREPKLAGRVAMVNTSGKFVLLECDVWTAPAEGTALKCLRYGAETAILAASKERRGSYVVADIVKGSPQRGDEVFK